MTRPRFELLKWLAVALMVGDHVNLALFDRSLPVLTELARVVMPLFAMVLGWNMATADAAARSRTFVRLILVGASAQPFYMAALDTGWLPLNVLLAFGLAVGVLELIERRMYAVAVFAFVCGGAVVEFMWPSVGLVLATVLVCRVRTWESLAPLVLAFGALGVLAGNWYALGALPLFVLVPQLRVRLPRAASAFYVFYPAHLALLGFLAAGV
jgi:hypothetical protein